MNVFSEAFRLAILKRNWKWVGGFSGIITTLSFIQQQDYDNLTKNKLVNAIIAFLFFLFSTSVLLYLYYLIRLTCIWIHNLYVESIWGQTIEDLADIYADIHQLERKPALQDNEIAILLSNFCDKVKIIFDRKTKSNCCISIKVPVSHVNDNNNWQNIQLKNIARDQKHISERDTQNYKNTVHNIIGNTAYCRIISLILKKSSKHKVFVDNDISKNVNYATTSENDKERKSIPYKSELVVPIIPQKYANLVDISFCGFLCIDSDKTNSFDVKRYDIPMAVGLADGLYSLINNNLK